MIIVKRPERVIDIVFTASVAIFVSIMYINFGCAMDWSVCHETLKRPIGPAIGLFCQFLFMPLVSFIRFQSIIFFCKICTNEYFRFCIDQLPFRIFAVS